MFGVIKDILISEEEFTENNFKRLKKALVYIKGLKMSNLLKFKLYIKSDHKAIVSRGQKIRS